MTTENKEDESLGKFDNVALFAKGKNNVIRVWSIFAEDFTIYVEYGSLGGEIIENDEFVPFGLGGRDRQEQMMLRINRMIQNKLDSGYSYSLEDAKGKARTNSLGLPRPMLANKFSEAKHKIDSNSVVQKKLNGFRLLTMIDISNINKPKIISYTRKGSEMKTLSHIAEELVMELDNIDIDMKDCNFIILDGELYAHGCTFQQISSWAKKKQKDTIKLNYVLYDVIFPDVELKYSERLQYLQKYFSRMMFTKVIDSIEINSIEALNDYFIEVTTDDYEGLMVKNKDGKYVSYRCDNILKVKSLVGSMNTYQFEEEFLVTDIKKTPKGVVVVNCVTKEGKDFRVTAPGKVPEKESAYKMKQQLIGRHITVQFSEWTQYGKPFQPIAIKFRDISID